MGTFVQALGFLPSCIPSYVFSLHIFTDKLVAFLALWKCQSKITSLQHLCELLPIRCRVAAW